MENFAYNNSLHGLTEVNPFFEHYVHQLNCSQGSSMRLTRYLTLASINFNPLFCGKGIQSWKQHGSRPLMWPMIFINNIHTNWDKVLENDLKARIISQTWIKFPTSHVITKCHIECISMHYVVIRNICTFRVVLSF